MREPEHRPWLLDVGRLVCWLAGLFFIVGALGVFDLRALTEDGAAPNPVLFAAGWVLLCLGFLITLAPQRQTYPGLYAFVGALLGSALGATIGLSGGAPPQMGHAHAPASAPLHMFRAVLSDVGGGAVVALLAVWGGSARWSALVA